MNAMEISNSKQKLGVAIITICFLNFVTGLSASNSETFGLVGLITVEGKTFYTERNLYLNWTNAGNYCSSAGLRLASIENRVQSDRVGNAILSRYGDGVFWTSGRDSRLIESVIWNNTESSPILDAFGGFSHEGVSKYDYCARVFTDYENQRLVLRMISCGRTLNILCESA